MKPVFSQNMSKVKHLVDAVTQSIAMKEYKEGEPLPSINKLSQKFGVSHDTAFKAFKELKARGVVDSTPTKGYFVSHSIHKILLLLDTYSPYKYELHDALTGSLPINYKVDLYFHQGRKERFDMIINDSIGRYNLYLVMNYENDVYSDILDKLDPGRTMLLDFGKFSKDKFAYVCQGFDQTLYDCMEEGVDLFKKYKKIVLVYPSISEHPKSCIPYFIKFCTDHSLGYEIVEEFSNGDVQEGVAYFLVRHTDLVGFIKTTRSKNLTLGRDVGLVTYNDEPMLEILGNGITVISTDFARMGEIAAGFITSRRQIQTYVPTRLIVRGSL